MAAAFHPDSLLGTTLAGRYRIVSHLASGGLSAVFRAEEVGTGRLVALKVLRPEHCATPALAERFRREAEIARSLDHPNVVRVLDAGGTPDGRLFMAMELLEGESLFERLRREGHLHPADAVPILVQICAGLEAAHARGIVHRDLKPENVFLREREELPPEVKLLDFGVAQVEGTGLPDPDAGMVVGTPEYLSPEQAQGRAVDPRADLYSVGIVAWRMLAGRHPFPVSSTRALLEKHAGEAVPHLPLARPELAGWPRLVEVVARACDKNRARRPSSAAELGAQLAAALPPDRRPSPAAGAPSGPPPFPADGARTISFSTPVPSPAASGSGPPSVPGVRRLVAWALGGVAVLAALTGGVALLRGGDRPAPASAGDRPAPGEAASNRPAPPRAGDRPAPSDRPAPGTAAGDSAPAAPSQEDLAALAAAVRAGGAPAGSAARTLVQAGERSVPALRAALAGSAGPARLRLLEALRAARPGGRVEEPGEWIPLLSDPDCDARRTAARVLGEADDPAVIPALSALAAQREGRSRRASGGDPRAGSVCGAVEAGEALERIRDAARPR